MSLTAQKSEDFDSFVDDLLGERSARPLIIVGASRVDVLLAEVLGTFFLPKLSKPREADELFEGGAAPLGTFSSRIKMCRRLGLIDDSLFKALEKLRLIRNECAHKVRFDDGKSPIIDHFRDLKRLMVQRESYQLTKNRYFETTTLRTLEEWQCLLLTLCVLLEAIRDSVRQTSSNKKAMAIAAK